MIIDAIKLMEKWKKLAESGNEKYGTAQELEQSIQTLKNYYKEDTKKYSIVMLAENPSENIIMGKHLTREEAETKFKELEKQYSLHYFEIVEEL